MSVDKNGLELKEGDIVILPCRITGFTGDGYREKDIAVETLEAAPSGFPAAFEVCSSQVIKGMQIPDLKMTTRTHMPESHHPLDTHKETSTITPAGKGDVKEVTDTSNQEKFDREVSPNQTRSQESFTQLQDSARAENIQPGDIVKYRDSSGKDGGEMRVLAVNQNPTTLAVKFQVADNIAFADNQEIVGFEVDPVEIEKVIKNIQPDPVTKPDAAKSPAPTFTIDPPKDEPPVTPKDDKPEPAKPEQATAKDKPHGKHEKRK